MGDPVLDRPALISAIESKLASPERPTAFLVLIAVQYRTGGSFDDPALLATLGEHLGAMTRQSDLIAPLDNGELAMVVFELPPIQRVAFTDGISTAIDALVSAIAPDADLVTQIGTTSLRHDDSLTEAFRAADRALCAASVRPDPIQSEPIQPDRGAALAATP